MDVTKSREVYKVPMGLIYCDMDFNCRKLITLESVTEFAQSIELYGLQTPIHIRKFQKGNYEYMIVAGHRRYRACQLLERTYIEAIILTDINEQHARILNLSENLDRKDLTPYEEALALVKIFPSTATLTKMSQILNRSREWCRRRRLIAELPEDIRLGFHSGLLGIRDIVAISTLHPEKRERAARRLLAAREGNSDIPMGTVAQEHPHRGTKEVRDLLQYFARKKIDGLVPDVLRWVLGYCDTKEIKRLTRKAEKDGSCLYAKD